MPPRPNPIAITTVKLAEVDHKNNKIKVKGLDILDMTLVIDIKPYWPQYDKVDKGEIPGWVNELEF